MNFNTNEKKKNRQCQQRALIKFPKNLLTFHGICIWSISNFILKINLIFFGKSPTTSAFSAPEFWEGDKNAKTIFICLSFIWCDPIMGEKKIPTKFSQCFFSAQYKRDETSKFSWQAKNVINFFTLKYKTLIKHIHILESAGLIYTGTKMYTHSMWM